MASKQVKQEPEQANVRERKEAVQVRNALGWGKINNIIHWLNPKGIRDSLRNEQQRNEAVRMRNACGWGEINQLVHMLNPKGRRDSLITPGEQLCKGHDWEAVDRMIKSLNHGGLRDTLLRYFYFLLS